MLSPTTPRNGVNGQQTSANSAALLPHSTSRGFFSRCNQPGRDGFPSRPTYFLTAPSEKVGRLGEASLPEKIRSPATNVCNTSNSGESTTKSASAPASSLPFVFDPRAPAGFELAILTASCSGIFTSSTSTRTRSIILDTLPASAVRSANRQTPFSTTQSRPERENRAALGSPAPAVASVTRQMPPGP